MRYLWLGLIIPPVFAWFFFGADKDCHLPLDSVSFFKNEVRPARSKPCFEGAYYRKAVSSTDTWLGIGGTVVLPTITFDSSRRNVQRPGQFLDNPSVYMGGSMDGQETDVGLTWAVVKAENGVVSRERKAFRPFFRRTAYLKTGQKDIWQDAPASKEFYWYPGEEVQLSVQVVSDGRLKIIVDGAGKRFEAEFEADGYRMDGVGEFKRVNAIDQVRNEGKRAQATRTRVENASWKETHLFRKQAGKVVQVPMHTGRFTDMRCPEGRYFTITTNQKQQKLGAEIISIFGNSH